MVELLQQFGDGFIQLRQRMEFAMAQCGDNPTLGQQNGILYLGLVPGFLGRAGMTATP